MREEEIDKERVLSLIGEEMETKSRALIDLVQNDGSREISALLQRLTKDKNSI